MAYENTKGPEHEGDQAQHDVEQERISQGVLVHGALHRHHLHARTRLLAPKPHARM